MNLERSENLSYIKIGKFWDEIVPEGCDKAKMVERYMRKHHIRPDDLYVFGDGQNDAAMLRLTGNSYAPKNALPCAKKLPGMYSHQAAWQRWRIQNSMRAMIFMDKSAERNRRTAEPHRILPPKTKGICMKNIEGSEVSRTLPPTKNTTK